MMKHAIIFDFDGVLADSFKDLFRLNQDAMRQIGQKLTQQAYCDLFLNNVHRSLNKAVPDLKKRKIFNAFKDREFVNYYASVQLFPFSRNLIVKLARRSALGIVSSTPRDLIIRLLMKNKLEKYFQIISGSQAASKKDEIIETVKVLGQPYEQTFFVTDTAGDIKAGQELQLKTAGVSWGFHPVNLLQTKRPEKIFLKPEELLEYF